MKTLIYGDYRSLTIAIIISLPLKSPTPVKKCPLCDNNSHHKPAKFFLIFFRLLLWVIIKFLDNDTIAANQWQDVERTKRTQGSGT